MITTNISERIKKYCAHTNENIIIFSAYIKFAKFEEYNEITKRIKHRTLLIRGRRSDFLNNASDLEALQLALSSGWKVYINKRVHAKLYCFDNDNALIGSANLTNSGISDGVSGNIEIVADVLLSEEDLLKIHSIISSSTKISTSEFQQMEVSVNSEEIQGDKKSTIDDGWEFEKNGTIKALFPEELLQMYSVPISSINSNILGIKNALDIHEIKNAFLESNEYLWLKQILEDKDTKTMSFGEISAKLHNSLISKDRVLRSDVKKYVSNLVSWINAFEDIEIYLEKPAYSTLFKLK